MKLVLMFQSLKKFGFDSKSLNPNVSLQNNYLNCPIFKFPRDLKL